MMNTIKKYWVLILISLFSLCLRIYKIADLPPSLNWDEISHGYNAYSILTTARDEWGVFLPSIFRAYGDYKLPVYIYVTTPFIFFFGLNEVAVRLPSALAGVGTIVFTFLLTRELVSDVVHNKKKSIFHLTPYIAAILVAIEPWSLFLSRGAFEANLALFLFTCGTYLLLCGLKQQSSVQYILSMVLLGLTLWTYNSYRVFTPIFLIGVHAIYIRDFVKLHTKSKSTSLMLGVVIFVFFITAFAQLTNYGGARYQEVRILDTGLISRINEARANGGSRIVHNKVTYFAIEFTRNYFSHFSPDFLISNGGSNYQFNIPGHGLIYPQNVIAVVLGLYLLMKRKRIGLKTKYFLLMWLIFSPIASSMTREAPHTLRAITMLPVPMILASFGLSWLLEYLKTTAESEKRKFIDPILLLGTVYCLLTVFFTTRYLSIYFEDYRNRYSQSWQYSYKQVSRLISDNYENYDKVIFTKKYGEPHEFLLFYMKWNPDAFRNDKNLRRFYQSNWYWVDSFDKFYFINDWQVNEPGKGEYVFNMESGQSVTCPYLQVKCLLITSPGNVPRGWNKIEEFRFLDGRSSFEIYENY